MTIAAVDESAAKAKVSKIERKVKMENLATGFKSDHAHHMNKITEEKTKAAEQLQTDQKVVSQGSIENVKRPKRQIHFSRLFPNLAW